MIKRISEHPTQYLDVKFEAKKLGISRLLGELHVTRPGSPDNEKKIIEIHNLVREAKLHLYRVLHRYGSDCENGHTSFVVLVDVAANAVEQCASFEQAKNLRRHAKEIRDTVGSNV